MSDFAASRAVMRGMLAGRLTARDCRLLAVIRVVESVAVLAVGQTTIPAARRTLARLGPLARRLSGPATEERVLRAIEASGCWLPATSTCLVRALTAELFLAGSCKEATVVIGVAAPAGGRLESHAWIERNGRVLVGGPQSTARYRRLVTWSAAP
jgi:hypothetical protein